MMSVEQAMAKAAASLLPGLLPTPPTKPCLIILPASFNSKTRPGRADSVERWDKKPTKTPASSCSSSSSPGRATSCGERWDINKRISGSSRTSSSSSSSSSSRRCSTSPGASSAGRWDAHKKEKPRPAQASAESRTSDKEDQEEETTAMVPNLAAPPRIDPMFSGPSFPVASPDPSMLPVPVPAFFRPRNPGVLPVQAAFLGVH